MTDLSDFARPPKSRHVREIGTFGQTIGLHPLVERRIMGMYNKNEMKRDLTKKNNSGTRETLEATELS